MRLLITGFLLLGLAVSAQAIDKAGLDKRTRALTTRFEEMQAKPDKRIPPENLRKAQGIILLDRTKAGLVFGYQGGSGLAMVKDVKSGHWSAPVFLTTSEGSFGVLVGGQQSFVVILLLNTNATRALTESSFGFGGEAGGTAGNASGAAEGTTASDYKPLMLVYTDTAGFYGGAAIKGGSLSPDSGAIIAYYGKYLTPKEILFGKKGTPTDAATSLAQKLTQFSK